MPKFLHIADIHLDSPFSNSDAAHAAQRRNEQREVFLSAMEYAKANGIDAILIAGDLFDTKFITSKTANMLKDAFESAGDCQIFISPGNHDPFCDGSIYSSANFPKNVHIFKSENVEKISLDRLGVDIYGYAFESESLDHSPIASLTGVDREKINILVAHGDIFSSISHYAPITKNDIANSKLDYVALGHIHNTDEKIENANGTYYSYSGAIEGRSFDECGVRGGILIDIQNTANGKKIAFEKLRFSKRRYEKDTLDISGISNEGELVSKIKTLCDAKGYSGDTLLRLELIGNVPETFDLSHINLDASLFDLFYLETVNSAMPDFDYERLTKDPTIKGEIFRLFKDKLECGGKDERRLYLLALRYALLSLEGEDLPDIL